MPITTMWLSRSPVGQKPLELQHFFDDLAGGQTADHAAQPARAEDAAHRAAHLGADADGVVSLVVAQQDALDPVAVGQFQQQLFGLVGRGLMGRDPRGPDLEGVGQLAAAAAGPDRSSPRTRSPGSAKTQRRTCAARYAGMSCSASQTRI